MPFVTFVLCYTWRWPLRPKPLNLLEKKDLWPNGLGLSHSRTWALRPDV
jgi:hypothetical protein